MPFQLSKLSSLNIFKDLPKEELEAIEKHVEEFAFQAHATLYEEKDEARGIFIILEGYVKVIRITSDGKEVVLFIARPGHLVGEGAVFQDGSHPASAIAIKKVKALFLPKKACIELVQKYPLLAMKMLNTLALRQRMFMHKLAAQGEKNALMRVAGYIKHRHSLEGENNSLIFDISREDLANLLGLARETVSRQISILIDCNAINIDGKTLNITDFEALEEIAGGK